VCGLNLESIKIQTLPLLVHLKFFFQIWSLDHGPSLIDPAGPTSSKSRPINQPLTPLPFLSPTDRARVSVNNSFSSLLPSPRTAPHQASHAAAAGARDGTPFPSGRPARRGTGARAHARRIRPRTGVTPFAPAPRTSASWSAQRGAEPPRPPGRSKPGQLGAFASTIAAPRFKGRGAETRAPKLPTPIGVFPFLFSCESAVRGRVKGALPLRRAEERRGHIGTPTTRQGRRPQPPPRGGKRRLSALGKGAESEWEHPRHQGHLHCPEHLRHATVYPEPATTTTPPQREHRRGQLLLPSPLVFFLWWIGDVETRRPLKHAWMLAFEPQDCRTATEGAPEPFVLLGAAIAVRGRFWWSSSRAVVACAGIEGCVAASLRAAPLATSRPHRSGHGEAACAQARLWPRTPARFGLERRLAKRAWERLRRLAAPGPPMFLCSPSSCDVLVNRSACSVFGCRKRWRRRDTAGRASGYQGTAPCGRLGDPCASALVNHAPQRGATAGPNASRTARRCTGASSAPAKRAGLELERLFWASEGDKRVEGLPPGGPRSPMARTRVQRRAAPPQGPPTFRRTLGGRADPARDAKWETVRQRDLGLKPSQLFAGRKRSAL
jgi:hypothetical protein